MASFLSCAEAHVPNIASFHLIPANDAWLLEVNMSTAGMHQALHPGESLSTLTPEAYRAQTRGGAGIELRVDGNVLSLSHPVVEVRSHASRVAFVIEAPESAHRIDAHIDALSASRLVLKPDNEFRGRLELSAPATIRAVPTTLRRLWLPVALLLVGLSLVLRFIRGSASAMHASARRPSRA